MDSNYDIEKLYYKYIAYKNSDYLKNNKMFNLKNDYEIKSLYEYYLDYKRENSRKSDISSFEKTLTELPELGEIEVYESVENSKNRKINSLKEEFGIEDEKEQKLLEYSIISLNEENKKEELVIDKDGNDLGILTYDEKGNPSFKISPNLKKIIDESLEKANVRNFVDEQTIQEEFYLKDINSLIKAIEEGMIVPESVKSAGERAAKAQNIKNGQYSSLDSTKTIIQTPEEIQNKLKEEEEVRKQLEDDEKDHERNITEKTVDKDGKDIEEKEEDGKKGGENKNIPEDKIAEINKICNKSEYSKDEIKSVLIIKDPSTLADCTENSKINRKGSELTIIQFSSIFGKEKYTIIQDGVELGGEQHDRAFRDLIAPLKVTSGVYKRVEDNENYVDYTDSSGKLKSMQLKRMPIDMTLEEKDNFRERLEIDLEKLEYVREVQPDNKALIDKLEIIVEDDFIKMGLTPPQSIKEDANDIQANPEEVEKASMKDLEEIDEDPDFDEVGRRRRTH